jgi:hypothetical protein
VFCSFWLCAFWGLILGQWSKVLKEIWGSYSPPLWSPFLVLQRVDFIDGSHEGCKIIGSLRLVAPIAKSPSLVLVINDTKLLMLLYQVEWVRHKQHTWWRCMWHKVMATISQEVEMHIKLWSWWSSMRRWTCCSSGGEGSKSARQRYNHRVFLLPV